MLAKLLILILCSFCSCVSVAADEVVLVLGDSISAGYGIPVGHGWVALLQKRLSGKGYSHHVVNASISGDTSRSAGARLKNLLDDVHPDIAVVELGGNDGLRGLALEEIEKNLETIIEQLKNRNSRVLLIPMQLPPNYGPVYTSRFQEMYQRLGQAHDIKVGEFILEGIGDRPELMQSDGIHPITAAQQMMLDNIWPSLQPMLEQ
jgi:acyl-CoA thioesterase-1